MLKARGYKIQRGYRNMELLQRDIGQVIVAQYGLWSVSGAALLPEEKVRRQAETNFKGTRFRCVEEVLDDTSRRLDIAV